MMNIGDLNKGLLVYLYSDRQTVKTQYGLEAEKVQKYSKSLYQLMILLLMLVITQKIRGV
jgi:hypothetical protein